MRPFFILWTGQALSLLGSQAVQFALIWWLTRETGSATVLAVAAFVGLLPPVLLGPFAGAWADRWNRKRVMLVADATVAAASLALAVLFALGLARVELVFAALLVRAIGGTFHGPAMIASTTLMVPKEHLTRIQGLNQSLQGGLMIVAAPLGGLLLAWLSMAAILLVDVATAAVAIATLIVVRVPQPDAPAEIGRPSVLRDVAAGFAYLRRRRGHMAIVGLATVINLFLVPAFSLLPLFVLEELRGSALQLAGMESALGIGTLAGGILLGVWGGFRRRIMTTLLGLALFGGATLVLGLAPDVAWATGAMLAVGFLVPLVNGPIQGVLQATIAPEYQGRVFTLIGSLAGLAAPVGLALAAPVAEMVGVRAWYVAGAAACVVMALAARLVRAVVEIEGVPGEAEAAPCANGPSTPSRPPAGSSPGGRPPMSVSS